MKESEFINVVNLIASNYNCKVFVDYKNQNINIDGPSDMEVKCAIAIGDLMDATNGITEVGLISEAIKIVKDNVGWVI